MDITFTKEETIKLLEEYYEKLEGKKVKVSIKTEKGLVGYYETEGCITTITIIDKLNILGMEKDVSIRLSEEDVNTNLRALFSLYNFDVNRITFNSGLHSRSEGYGMCEHQVKSAYFNGITVSLAKDKNKGLVKKKEVGYL